MNYYDKSKRGYSNNKIIEFHNMFFDILIKNFDFD